MKFKKPIITLLCFFSFVTSVFAGVKISGTVVDEKGNALDVANIVLLHAKDNALAKSTISNEQGKYELENVKEGEYVLKIDLMGYSRYSSEKISVTNQDVALKEVVLQVKSKSLKAVTVRASKPLIEVHADKLVVNVENSIINAGSSAMEVLKNSPSVSVDDNDNISIKGKQGVNIMVDGKRMILSGVDLANMLKSTPSNSIKKIEIISNPGARYDAAGTAGVINIVTKRDKRLGMNGSVNAAYAQGVYPKGSAGINLNYRNKKLSSYVSYNYSNRGYFNHLKLNRRFYSDNDAVQFSYVQDNFNKMFFKSHRGTFGMDYALSKKTIVGVAGSVGTNGFSPRPNNQSKALDGNGDVIYNFETKGKHRQDYYSYSANANLRHNFNEKGKNLAVDVDYARYWNQSNQNFETVYRNPDGTLYQPNYFMRSDLSGITQIRSAKVDYTLPLKKNARFEAGAKSSYVTSDNEPLFYEKTTGDYILDSNRSNHFIYKENINAGYVNFNKKWGKWSTQIGFRVENTNVTAEQVTLDSTFENSYTQLFPSLAVQRTLTEKHSVGLTLSRRIQRPNYQQLNPFKFFIDNTTYRAGYPYLRPALTYAVEASHIYKKRFSTTLGYSRTTDNITQVIQPSETEDSVTVQTDKNLATMHYYGFSGAYPFQITKWWNSVANINIYYSHFVGQLANTNLSNGAVAYTVSTNNSFTLPKGFSAQVTAWYQAPQVYGFMDLKAMWSLGFGVQKQVFNSKGTIRLNATDIFWTSPPRAVSTYTAYQEDFAVKRETRQVSLSFSYRFGKRTVAPARRRKSGADDLKQRIGNQQ